MSRTSRPEKGPSTRENSPGPVPGAPALQASPEAALQVSGAPPSLRVASVLGTGIAMRALATAGKGGGKGLVKRLRLTLVALPPALVALTAHWKTAVLARSAALTE